MMTEGQGHKKIYETYKIDTLLFTNANTGLQSQTF